MLNIGRAKVDITPKVGGWMDGMHRAHGSTSIHDPLNARALAFDDGKTRAVIVSCEIVDLSNEMTGNVRSEAQKRTGVPANNILLACMHNHSGPATMGYLNPRDDKYLLTLPEKLLQAIEQAVSKAVPAKVGIGRGQENTISYYRRLWHRNGRIVMNWEPVDSKDIIGPAGEPDHEVGVMKIVSAEDQTETLATVFHYTTHPNVLSGESFMISAEFPGLAARILEQNLGGSALFLNGAQGSSDINGLNDRDWAGVQRTGEALAKAVAETAEKIDVFRDDVKIATGVRHIQVPIRNVSDEEVSWAQKVLAETTDELVTLADGVTDDFKANIIMELLPKRGQKLSLDLFGLAVGDMAFVSFPGELFTETGLAIKKASPFKQTYVLGLTNGSNGYFPTTKAISEGGYSVDVRKVDPPSEQIIIEASVSLLQEVAKKVS